MGFRDTLKKWDAEDADKPKKGGGELDWLPHPDEIFKQAKDTSGETDPVAGASGTSSDLRTTVATSPQHSIELKEKDAKEREATGAMIPSAAYGAARGISLGGVDRIVGAMTALGEHAAAGGAPSFPVAPDDGGKPRTYARFTDIPGQRFTAEQIAGATATPLPASPHPYMEGRKEYLAEEDKARKLAPISHFLGEAVAAAPATIVAPESLVGRLAVSGGLGAVSGALNTREDNVGKMLKNAGVGAAFGTVAEGTVGTLARKAIRGSAKREIDQTVRDVMESEAGRATATTGKKLAKDVEDIRDMLKQNPDAREAVRGPAKDALPVIKAKADAAYDGQLDRYKVIDNTVKPITVTQLLGKIVAAEKDVPENRLPLVKKGLKALRDSLREDFAPKWSGQAAWNGQKQDITTDQLRKWVSSVQGTAEAAMGGINGTNAAKVPADIAKIANKILEDRLDAAAAKGGKYVAKTVAEIRESDRQVSAWLGVKRALEDRNIKELAQNAGLSTRLGHAGSQNANSVGLALAAEGHPVAGATVAAKGVISRGANVAGRAINNRILVPLQEAAERGATLAELTRFALESGIPQGVVRALFEQKQERKSLKIPKDSPALGTVPQAQQVPPTPQAIKWPRDYATTTKTQ
jgi:hypothetical protein